MRSDSFLAKIHAYLQRKVPTFTFCAILLGLATLCSLFDGYSLILELSVHFLFQYALGAVIFGVLLWIAGRKKLALFLAILCLWNSGRIAYAVYSLSGEESQAGAQTLSILQFNARHSNRDKTVADTLRELSETHGLIVFSEFPDALRLDAHDGLKEVYPYRYVGELGTVFFEGIAIFSQYPLEIQRLKQAGTSEYNGVVRVFIPEKQIVLYALHSPTPIPLNAAQERDAQQYWVFSILADEPYPAIALGDFNQTPYASNFQRALRRHSLNLAGFPDMLLPTWPRQWFLPILQIPIDLAVTNNQLAITSRARISISGSDHVAVSNRIALREENAFD